MILAAFNLMEHWKQILLIAGAVIVLLVIVAVFLNKGRYAARFNGFYKRIDRIATKRFNSNLFIETLLQNDVKDQTNTYKSLKGRGKSKVNKYLDFYVKNLPELVILKSFISPDKNKNQLAILLLDESDRVLCRWDKTRKVKGLIKMANKYQMLTPILAFLYELPMNIKEGVPFRFKNHDNDYTLTYDILKNARKTKRKVKERKLTRAELKAQERIAKIKAKKEMKRR
ncbi:MAG TPA: hypothetical protein P5154_04710 [Candidatus Izemoplasmatales bacterium]|nr:hypothetical protein [Bacillota bacterium]HRY78047.1 hypothetical protein [Candidatus Izemoplasmatales bacterium]